ncbi:hypothetical protein CCHL11_09650 [Colletotrichum chlorophyti]|uniref:T6SS Phospholipase effector Tle1-like catalytic domain-containing protein n=1 Tax=Colletotrichum chlorophyti TaxID=708187 RepID=A0A1Q8RFE1_9PEZI|nr:hypothetical protein CCHL11_09650 [Colletotrichum chlorophyti]
MTDTGESPDPGEPRIEVEPQLGSCSSYKLWTIDGGEKWDQCAHNTPEKEAHKKRLIVCCDGTWNNANGPGGIPTNVARLSSAVAHKCCTGMPQVVYYHRGAGTEKSKIARFLGGFLGWGVIEDVADVYRFICDNYNPGDEIVIIGFSRGAFTARSVAGMVCSIGLLNRFGLANFGPIFEDYRRFSEWNSDTAFDPQTHLTGLNIHNSDRLTHDLQVKGYMSGFYVRGKGNIEILEMELNEEKEKLFQRLKHCDGEDRLQRMADIYRDYLHTKFKMVLCEKTNPDDADCPWIPLKPTVKAVGVWDTVGSLGFPKMPWEGLRMDRSPQELRFASFNVHERVDYAFHALALDEWRTAFMPTLWGISTKNKNTHLRQVWFPGSHSDVGGGFVDQQIATISLAWMADQLTSIGVEFTPSEMLRIFRTVDLKAEARPWALGKINSPGFITALPDIVCGTFWYMCERYLGRDGIRGTRNPGLQNEDNSDKGVDDSQIVDDKQTQKRDNQELVHPSVRLRFLYGGRGLEDIGEWECVALTKNKYKLEQSKEDRPDWAKPPDPTYTSTYKTLCGDISSAHGGMVDEPDEDSGSRAVLLVPRQLPFEEELYTPSDLERWVREEELYRDLVSGNPFKPVQQWVWRSEETGQTLHEEHIGMWQRLFIKTSQEQISREQDRKAHADEDADEDTQKVRPEATRSIVSGISAQIRNGVTSVAAQAKQTILGIAGRGFHAPTPFKALKPLDHEPDYGYHGFILWQQGDMRTRHHRIRKTIYPDGSMSALLVLDTLD